MTAFTKSITELPQRSQVYVLDSYETIIFRISLLLKQAARVHLRAQGMELTPSDLAKPFTKLANREETSASKLTYGILRESGYLIKRDIETK